MERGCGRRHGTGAAGEYGLVIGPVVRIGGAAAGNIGRQGHIARSLNRGIERVAGLIEAQFNLTLVAGGNFGGQPLRKLHPVAQFQPFGGAGERAPMVGTKSCN